MQYAIALAIFPMLVKLVWDIHLFLSRKNVNHRKEWIILASFEVIPIFLFTRESAADIWISGLSAIVFISFGLWFAFNTLYNIGTGRHWLYVSLDKKTRAITDAFLANFKPWQRPIIQLVPFAVFLTLYILTL